MDLSPKDIVPRLHPFTAIRPVGDLRIGILTISEKWESIFGPQVRPDDMPEGIIPGDWSGLSEVPTDISQTDHRRLDRPWQMPSINAWAITSDYNRVTRERESNPIPDTVQTTNRGYIFVEDGVRFEHCTINASDGPVYIGKNVLVMDGAMLRGPLAVCEGAVVKMGAALYGGTTIGKHCIVGGEVKNSILMDFSNKAHHGYIGDAVIGAWCNLGAGTSCSNVKNTGGGVKVWNMQDERYESAGIKCGLFMGDFSRSAINTSFNTGTVVGISANVLCEGLSPKHIPDFTWGCGDGMKYEVDKAIHDIRVWMGFKGHDLSPETEAAIRGRYGATGASHTGRQTPVVPQG